MFFCSALLLYLVVNVLVDFVCLYKPVHLLEKYEYLGIF